jgi:hypothetical protein
MNPEELSRPSRAPAAVVAIVAVLAVAIGLAFYSSRHRETSKEIAPGETLVTAPSGTVVGGFPKELILEPSASAAKSYRIDYASGSIAQPVLAYPSGKSLKDNFAAFKDYFAKSGWTLTGESLSSAGPVAFLYAVTGNASANVTIQDVRGKVTVTIAYASP